MSIYGPSMWDLHKTQSAHVERNKGKCHSVQECESLQFYWNNSGAHGWTSCSFSDLTDWENTLFIISFLDFLWDLVALKVFNITSFTKAPILSFSCLDWSSSFISCYLHLFLSFFSPCLPVRPSISRIGENPYGRAAGWDACSCAQPRCPHPPAIC